MSRPLPSSESEPRTPGSEPRTRRPSGEGVRVVGGEGPPSQALLTPEALDFIARLSRRFGPRRERLLADRRALSDLRARPATGPPVETRAVRHSTWTVPSPPPGLETRWVEIVGEPSARTIVHALNSKANGFVADFEDLHHPDWGSTLHAQWNLARAVRRTLEYVSPGGERFRVVSRPTTILVRPRAWHRDEPHVKVDGLAVPAALFDLGLYAFHNARELVRCGTGPYFYLPKLEHYLEAALWEEVFDAIETDLGMRTGTVRATSVIETVPAAWEMEEILFALRPHSAGLAFGRMGLTFSQLKGWRYRPDFPDPALGPTPDETSFVAVSARKLIETCHRRGAQATNATTVYLLHLDTGGPIRPETAQELAEKVRDARAGYDGTWVAHPGAVPAVREFFAARVPVPGAPPPQSNPVAHSWTPSVPGLPPLTARMAIRAAVRYIEARLRGVGSVVVDHVVQDAASVEIDRTWLWLWTHFDRSVPSEGPHRTEEVRRILGEERLALVTEAAGDPQRLRRADRAVGLVDDWATGDRSPEFLTTSVILEPPN